jgi:hypothetical protein
LHSTPSLTMVAGMPVHLSSTPSPSPPTSIGSRALAAATAASAHPHLRRGSPSHLRRVSHDTGSAMELLGNVECSLQPEGESTATGAQDWRPVHPCSKH